MLGVYPERLARSMMQLMDMMWRIGNHNIVFPGMTEDLWSQLMEKTALILEDLYINCAEVDLHHAMTATKRAVSDLRRGRSIREAKNIAHEIHEIKTRLLDELITRKFYYVHPDDVAYYDHVNHFADARKKLPNIDGDCLEAGKCLALGRYTASVFHLMRVMEFCVIELGNKLGILNATEKTWGQLTNEMDNSIKKNSDKAGQAEYATVLSHLNVVRLAWRNPTMHPKSSYSKEEAQEIFRHVQTFCRSLSSIL